MSYAERYTKYMQSSDATKLLLDLLYGNPDEWSVEDNADAYASIKPDEQHALERVIIGFEDNMDNDGLLRAIAADAGFYLDEDDIGVDAFVNTLYDFITTKVRPDLSDDVTGYYRSDDIKQVMQLTPQEFYKRFEKEDPARKNLRGDRFYPYELYADRTRILI